MTCDKKTRNAHRSRLRHVQLRLFLRRPGIELTDHLPRPLAVDLPRSVLAFSKHRMAPLIHQVSQLRDVRNLFRKMRWNEGNALRVSHGDVAGHDRCLANPDRDVDSSEHHVLKRRRVHVSRVDLESLDLLNSARVPHSSVHDETVVAARVNRGRQVVANNRSVPNLSKQLDDQYVARLENVDDARVFAADSALLLSIGADYGINIRTGRHEDRS